MVDNCQCIYICNDSFKALIKAIEIFLCNFQCQKLLFSQKINLKNLIEKPKTSVISNPVEINSILSKKYTLQAYNTRRSMGVLRNIWGFLKNCCPKNNYIYHSEYSGFFQSSLDLEQDSTEWMVEGNYFRIIYFAQPHEKKEDEEEEGEEVLIKKSFYNFF